jgi:tetratricopeptide (TPR) repeat protein
MKVKTAILAAVLFSFSRLAAQEAHSHLRKADKAYKNGNYAEAEINYRKALEQEPAANSSYNLGNTTYRQQRFDEALKHYETAAADAKDKSTKAKAYHNLGNAHFKAGNYEKSIEAYKNALRLNPQDQDTRQNLVNALRKLPPPSASQQPQNQQDKKDQGKDQPQKQQGNNNQQPQRQPQTPQPQSVQQQEQSPDNGKSQAAGSLDREQARKMLEIMDQEEQRVQQKLRKAQGRQGRRTNKDW